MRVPIKPSEMKQGMRIFWREYDGEYDHEYLVLDKKDFYLNSYLCANSEAVLCRLRDGELYVVTFRSEGQFTVECPDCYLCS